MGVVKITSERIGSSVLVTVEDCCREIAFLLPVDSAARFGSALLMQATRTDDGLELPKELRP